MPRLTRRSVLKGLGTAISLPLLDAMEPLHSLAAASDATAKPPLRVGFFYVPNGVDMPEWKPKKQGVDFDLPSILQPLEKHKDRLLVLSGLTHDKARANGDGPGDHARSVACFLTGTQPYKTNGANIHAGVSVDQVAAQRVGHLTRFASLELGIDRGRQAGNCDSGYSCAYSSNMSWKTPSTPVAKEIDPRLVFERLFSDDGHHDSNESRDRRKRYQKSILDFVLADANRLSEEVGGADRQKLDEYFTSIREVEKRITRVEQFRKVEIPADVEHPEGIPPEYEAHVKLMLDILALAYRTDSTRIASFMFANAGSNRSYRNLDISDGHHELSHHRNDAEKLAKISKINHFHVSLFSYFLDTLRSIPEGDGNLLDNVMLVYGSAIGDGNRHNHNDLPMLLLGGGAGSLSPGRHVVYPGETPVNNMFLSLLDRMNVGVTGLGDSTGRLKHLQV